MIKKLILVLAASASLVGAAHAQTTIVQWGKAGGEIIVSGNQSLATGATTYSSGGTINPAQGANYYSSPTGRSYAFNGAFSETAGGSNNRILDAASNRDQLQTSTNGNTSSTTFKGMVVWEAATSGGFLASASNPLTSLSAEAYRNTGTTSGTLRFLFQASDSSWQISTTTFSLSTGFPASPQTISDVSTETWLSFTPFSSGTATIGSASGISNFSNVKAVGYYFDITKTTNNSALLSTDYFQATTAVPEPTTFGLLGLGALGFGAFRVIARRRR